VNENVNKLAWADQASLIGIVYSKQWCSP